MKPSRVDAVDDTATGRRFLIVGEEDLDTFEADDGNVLASLGDMKAHLRGAPRRVRAAWADVERFVRATDEDEDESYGYPAPKGRPKPDKARRARDEDTSDDPDEDDEEDDEKAEKAKMRRQPPKMVKCPECGTTNPEGSKECRECGASLAEVKRRSPILAAAFPLPETLVASWFDDPGLSEPTPLTVTDEGRIYGHVALFGTCHVGIKDNCTVPPTSKSRYAFFRTGCIRADGKEIPVGQITMGTGHATLSADATQAAAHYDNTGAAVADVAAGEDSHGVWVAGTIRKGTTLEQVEALRASAPSGDWRAIGGSMEMVAVLAVNVPGFPVPRSLAASAVSYDDDGNMKVFIASGQQGADTELTEWMQGLEARIASIESVLKPLRPVAAAAIRERITRQPPKPDAKDEKTEDDEDEDAEADDKEKAKVAS